MELTDILGDGCSLSDFEFSFTWLLHLHLIVFLIGLCVQRKERIVTSYNSVSQDTQYGNNHKCYLLDSRESLDLGWGDVFCCCCCSLIDFVFEVGIRIGLY